MLRASPFILSLHDARASWRRSAADGMSPGRAAECALCGARATMSCGGCGGFFYCGRAHQVRHWTSGHSGDCERTARQVVDAEALRVGDDIDALPWSRTATVDVDEGRETRCTALGPAHLVGPYRRECACLARIPFGRLPPCDRPEGDVWRDAANSSPQPDVVDDARSPARTWPRLYARLGLPLTSRAALALSTAATVWRAAQLCVSAASPGREPHDDDAHPRPFVIHIIGVEKELDQAETIAEMIRRLGVGTTREVRVWLVGPEAEREGGEPEDANGPRANRHAEDDANRRSAKRARRDDDSYPRVIVRARRGLYHDVASAAESAGDATPTEPASLVVAPNAGVAAFESWAPTVRLLVRGNAPVVITDFTEEAARMAREAWMGCAREGTGDKRGDDVGGSSRGRCTEVTSNPLRQPMSAAGSDTALPAYSNGFVFAWVPGEDRRFDDF